MYKCIHCGAKFDEAIPRCYKCGSNFLTYMEEKSSDIIAVWLGVGVFIGVILGGFINSMIIGAFTGGLLGYIVGKISKIKR